MLYYIFYPLRDLWFGFNVFRYITFRAAGAAIMAFIIRRSSSFTAGKKAPPPWGG